MVAPKIKICDLKVLRETGGLWSHQEDRKGGVERRWGFVVAPRTKRGRC